MPRIAVVSMFDDNYSRMAETTIFANFSKYCEIHSYDLIAHKIDPEFLEGRHAQWGKIKLIKKILTEQHYDWAFFVDCDCLIMNLSISLDQFIDDRFLMIVPEGGGAPDFPVSTNYRKNNLMSSQMLIKNTTESIQLLEEIWNAPDWPEGMSINEFDHEMRQLRISSKKVEWRGKIKWIEEKKLNRFWPSKNPYVIDAFPHMNKNLWSPGDFIVHVTSYQKNERIEILNLLQDFVGGKIGGWRLDGNKIWFKPLKDLSYFSLVVNIGDNQTSSWEFTDFNTRTHYWVQIGDNPNSERIIVRAFDNLKNGIALYSF